MNFRWIADFGNEHHRYALLLALLDRIVVVLVEPGVHFRHVVTLMSIGNGHIRERLDVFGLSHKLLHHAEDDFWSCERIAGTFDHAVRDDQDNLVRVGVISRGERIESCTQAFDRLGIGRHQQNRMGERVIERLVVGGRLRDNVAERERASAAKVVVTTSHTIEL